MALELIDDEQAVGTLVLKDAKGNQVKDATVEVTMSDEAVATVSYDATTGEATVKAGSPGVAALKTKVTNQDGSDLPFLDTAIEVKTGDATQGSIVFGAATKQ